MTRGRWEEERRMSLNPAHIRAQIADLLVGLPGSAADGENQLAEGEIDEIARRLSEAHDVLVRALESAEKG
jgi:RNase H-fold protein (predicted Holliday junction resolvase)